MNVRPVGTIENRERGGSRPALIQSHQDDLGSDVRFLFPMILAPGDGFTCWSETFGGSGMAAAWDKKWFTTLPSILQQMASIDTSVADAGAVRDTLDPAIDISKAYTVEMLIVPWNGAFHGNYRLYVRLDDATPAITTDGVMIDLTMTGSGGVYTGTATSYVGGDGGTEYALTGGTLAGSVARPVWLIAQVTADTVVVTLDGTTILNQAMDGAQNGLRFGFGLKCTVDAGLCLANVLRVQYYTTGSTDALRTMLIASADGSIWKEGPYGRMTVQVFDPVTTVRSDVSLTVAQSGQKLYIADYGDLRITQTDGIIAGDQLTATANPTWNALGISAADDVVYVSSPTDDIGTYRISSTAVGALTLTTSPGDANGLTFRIERAPKVYDPIANTLIILTATEGAGGAPTGCPLICRHLDRIFLAGAEIAPHVWYAARQGTETDFDYSQEDDQRAVSGPLSEAGVPGTAITAEIPHSDDYLVMGCRHELWRMRGDPAFSGDLDALSHTVGIVEENAWCWGPTGELIFLSLDGIYILPPGGDSRPISMSREVLPQELLNFNPNTTTILLEYDVQDRGVHIYLTPESSNARIHYFFDWERKTFWPLTLTSTHEPTATCALQATAIEDSGVILGGRDGILRRFSGLAETDCGEVFTTYIDVGPIPLAPDGVVGVLMSMDAVMAEDSGDVTWEVSPALSFEAAAGAAAQGTGTWVAGLNATAHPGGRGQAYMLTITGSAGRRWAFEQIVTATREAGRRRIA